MATERALTARLARLFGPAPGAVVDNGDDAAVMANRHRTTVLCCDPVVEDVHFTAADPLPLVGRKAVNRNLSDLAAMGATPDWLLLSIVAPRRLDERDLVRLCRGVRHAAERGGAHVVGGDVAVSHGPLVVTVTAVGHLTGKPLRRDAARIGDTIHVTGALGGSRLGRHLRFQPELAAGAWLAAARGVHAAIDVSDGLLLDLDTVLRASGGLGAELDAAAIPVSSAARRLAAGDRDAALRHACGDGEDHVLLWTQRAGTTLPAGGPLRDRARRAIGRVVAEPGLWLCAPGRRTRVEPLGYQHALAPVHRRTSR